jgi:hypothetical protein
MNKDIKKLEEEIQILTKELDDISKEHTEKLDAYTKISKKNRDLALKLGEVKTKLFKLTTPPKEYKETDLMNTVFEIRTLIERMFKKNDYIYHSAGYFKKYNNKVLVIAFALFVEDGFLEEIYCYKCNNCQSHHETLDNAKEISIELSYCDDCEKEAGFYIEKNYRKV